MAGAYILFTLLVWCLSTAWGAIPQDMLDSGLRLEPEVYMNVSQLITSKGYPFEEHPVTTQDGYILGVHRIPTGHPDDQKVFYQPSKRPVVLLQHGLLASSSCWVNNLANQSLAFILADNGMDVWMGNSRGNKYSRKHVTLNPDDDKAFWQFSWDEMAKYDLPATIDYILNQTGSRQIYYIGHSQGTEIGFAGFAMDWNKEEKIKTFFALAPVAHLGHIKSPIRALVPFIDPVELFFDMLGHYEFLPNSKVKGTLGQRACEIKGIDYVCENTYFLIMGFDDKNTNITRLPVYMSERPAGTSVQNMAHYAQSVKSGNFQMYDYGSPEENLNHYNQTTPPLYDVTKMKTPSVLYWGQHDWLADPTDVNKLIPKLRNLIDVLSFEEYNHTDFLEALNAATILYSDIIKRIHEENKQNILVINIPKHHG